jgi:hypothetical protein
VAVVGGADVGAPVAALPAGALRALNAATIARKADALSPADKTRAAAAACNRRRRLVPRARGLARGRRVSSHETTDGAG